MVTYQQLQTQMQNRGQSTAKLSEHWEWLQPDPPAARPEERTQQEPTTQTARASQEDVEQQQIDKAIQLSL